MRSEFSIKLEPDKVYPILGGILSLPLVADNVVEAVLELAEARETIKLLKPLAIACWTKRLPGLESNPKTLAKVFASFISTGTSGPLLKELTTPTLSLQGLVTTGGPTILSMNVIFGLFIILIITI